MSRRLHSCLACPGKTRHRAICAACRRRGVTVAGDTINVPLDVWVPEALELPRQAVRLLTVEPKNIHAPTVAELQAGIDLTRYLTLKETS